MELFVVGQGKVRLDQADFLAQGGQAAIYVQRDRAFKVYHDPAHAIPPAKVQELQALDHPAIIRPQALLLDSRNRPVGYTMRRLPDAHVLCEVFNRAFRERKGLTPDAMLALVRKLQSGVEAVHRHRTLIVDLNEMNFLLDRALQEVFFIDVDSYQTPGFPATVIMDSIRDRHATRFTCDTDWFSFAITSFQMLVGIHPYKGKHPTLAGLDARMLANLSVLNRDVTVPRTCYPFSVIPDVYRDWYRALFEDGRRCPPPRDLRATIVIQPRVEQLCGNGALQVTELYRFSADVIAPVPAAGTYVALTTEGLFLRGARHPVPPDARAIVTPRMNALVAAWIEGGRLVLYDVTRRERLAAEIAAEGLTAAAGHLYVKQGTTLAVVELLELPAGLRAALRPVANVLEHATRLFEGAALQDVLGSWYATLFPQAGTAYSCRLPELDGCRIIDARFDGGVLLVLAHRDGAYRRFVFRFAANYRRYDVRVVDDVTPGELNFVTLESGVCVHLLETGELELFHREPGSAAVKVLADTGLEGARLFRNGTQLLAVRGSGVYAVTMRPGD